MANLAASGVTVLEAWLEKTPAKTFSVYKLQLVLAAMGTATNTIPASALGLTFIDECSPLIMSDNTIIVVATPSYDGTLLLLKAIATAAPADYTGTFRCIVKGRKP